VNRAIEVENLSKFFPPAHSGWRALAQPFARATIPAVQGVSLAVAAGEAVALVGANGAGKSTLLRILATLVLPTSGRAVVGGCDVAGDPAGARRQIGLHTGSDGGFYRRLSAQQNLEFFAALNNLDRCRAAARIGQVVSLLGLGDVLARQVRTLSTGTVHRLGLARALLHAPVALLLDEPTRSLDPLTAADFHRFLRDEVVAHGTTLLFATHSLAEAEELAARIAVLDRGRLVACDSPQRLRAATGAASLEQALERLTRRSAPAGHPPSHSAEARA
jgi:ABC-2 type transport system ATP-binding protein